jgi:rRNA-processing protein FCF1
MQKVIIDTNMLLVPGQHKVDVFTELGRILDEPYEIVLLETSLDELKRLATGTGADAQAAKLGLLLVEHMRKRDFAAADGSLCKGLKTVPSSKKEHVDDAIVRIAEDETLVATNDNGLKRRLLEKGVRVIYLRQQKTLAIST